MGAAMTDEQMQQHLEKQAKKKQNETLPVDASGEQAPNPAPMKSGKMGAAFDGADLLARLKAVALPSLKEPAKAAVGEIIDWAADGLAKNENAFIKGIAPLLVVVKEPINKVIDEQFQ